MATWPLFYYITESATLYKLAVSFSHFPCFIKDITACSTYHPVGNETDRQHKYLPYYQRIGLHFNKPQRINNYQVYDICHIRSPEYYCPSSRNGNHGRQQQPYGTGQGIRCHYKHRNSNTLAIHNHRHGGKKNCQHRLPNPKSFIGKFHRLPPFCYQ